MSDPDTETATAVAAAIDSLRDSDENKEGGRGKSQTGKVANGLGQRTIKSEPMEEEEVAPDVSEPEDPTPPPPPPPKRKVMSCLICTSPVTPENTKMGCSNSSNEYEGMVRVAFKLLSVDTHPMLKEFKFQHSEEPKKLCCDDCCEVVFNLGSLQSIIDRTKLAMSKKLEWIFKTVTESAAKEDDDEVEPVFFSEKSEIFRAEVLQVCQRQSAKNGLVPESDDEEEEMVNQGVQTDISGKSGVSNGASEKKSTGPVPYSFDDANMDTYSDHNNDDDMAYGSGSGDHFDANRNVLTTKKSRARTKSLASSASSNSKSTPAKPRARPSTGKHHISSKFNESDGDEIEIIGEMKSPKKQATNKGGRPPATKSPRMGSKEVGKPDQKTSSGPGGRPKRAAVSKRPNYKMDADDVEDNYSPSKRRSNGAAIDSPSKKRKPSQPKEVILATKPIVKDASGRTYFEGVEIVRTDRNISCKYKRCYHVVEGSGYNAFEQIKLHIHDTHI